MIVHVGRRDQPKPIPSGNLPVFSVGSQEEADALIELALAHGVLARQCGGDLVAVGLAYEQSLERLGEFGADLAALHDEHLVPTARCECVADPAGERRKAKAAAKRQSQTSAA